MPDSGPTGDGSGLLDAVPGPHGDQPIVTAGAPRGATEAVVLALHGRGATAQGIVNLLDPVARHGVTFVAPNAARSRWYPYATTAPRERNEPHVASALAVVDALVEHITDRFGVQRNRIVLTGFSQGGSVAAEYVASHPARYGGLAVLSGTLPGPTIGSRHFDGSLDGTPILVAVGAADPRVPADRVTATADVFRALGGEVTERHERGAGHAVSDASFEFLSSLLTALVGE